MQLHLFLLFALVGWSTQSAIYMPYTYDLSEAKSLELGELKKLSFEKPHKFLQSLKLPTFPSIKLPTFPAVNNFWQSIFPGKVVADSTTGVVHIHDEAVQADDPEAEAAETVAVEPEAEAGKPVNAEAPADTEARAFTVRIPATTRPPGVPHHDDDDEEDMPPMTYLTVPVLPANPYWLKYPFYHF